MVAYTVNRIGSIEMERVFEFLGHTPKAARERTEINPPVRVPPYGSHIIVYLIDNADSVCILRIRQAETGQPVQNHRRILEPIGSIPSARTEQRYYAALDKDPKSA